MKKLTLIFATIALMAMTACNEKPAKTENAEAPAKEQVDTAKQGAQPKVNVEKAAPTEDGKDHTVAEFNTKEYQVKLENLADGTYRLSMWKADQDKSGKPERLVETKKCVLSGKNYLMKDDEGNNYIISNGAKKQEVTIMNANSIIYHGENAK